MKAIQNSAFGGYDENRVVDLPRPQPAEGEVLLGMRTVAVSPRDNTFRSGHHPAAIASNLPRIGGESGVGVVLETKSPSFAVGDRAVVSGGPHGRTVDGTWCEFMAAPASALRPVPAAVDDDTAAAFVAGAGYLTCYLALIEFADFKPGKQCWCLGSAVPSEWEVFRSHAF
jgi:NADPH2:quinone reductase